MPRARALLSYVFVLCFCVDLDLIGFRWVDRSVPVRGMSCFAFYRPRESTGYSGGKEKNEREKKSLRIVGSFSFMWVPPTL